MRTSELSTQNFIDCCQLAGNKAAIKLPGKPDYPGVDGYSVSLTSEFLELKKNEFQQCYQQPTEPSRNTSTHCPTLQLQVIHFNPDRV